MARSNLTRRTARLETQLPAWAARRDAAAAQLDAQLGRRLSSDPEGTRLMNRLAKLMANQPEPRRWLAADPVAVALVNAVQERLRVIA